ncbi:MAG: hypothetical protein ACU84Q_18785 [Gammaproteobacteria bacterium]
MSESDAIAALTDIGESAATFFSLWVSVTFAYLTVAYFVGKSLTRFQCLAISAPYIASGTTLGASAQGYAEAWVKMRTRVSTVFDDVAVFANVSIYGEAAALVVVAGTVLSLYFMPRYYRR